MKKTIHKLVALALMGLALAVATRTKTDDMNISSIVDDVKISPAYIDWDLGIMLTEAKEYTGYANTKNYIGYADSKIMTTWQKFYLQKSRYQRHQLEGKEGNITLRNSTVTVEVYGRMGKWKYHSVTSCNALLSRSNLNFRPVTPAGSGLLPITCGVVRLDNLPDYIHCNVIYRQSVMQAYNSTSESNIITPIQTLNKLQIMHSYSIQSIYSPVSRDAIISDKSMVFKREQLNNSQIKGVYMPEAEHMDNDITTNITLNSLQNIAEATMCSNDMARLVLPIGGILMNGALLYCFDFGGEIVATTKRAISDTIKTVDLADCNKIFDSGHFKLVLYDGSDQRTNTRAPIQYLYNLNMTKDGWNITCTSIYYQVNASVGWNGWAQEFFVISNKYLWNYVNSCTVGLHTGPIQTFDRTLQYLVDVNAGFVNVTQSNKYGGPDGGYGSSILLYPYPDWDSVGALEREENVFQIIKITTSSSGTWCLLNFAYNNSRPTNLSYTPWEAVIANSTISDLVQLGINSGYGVNNVPTITQLKNEMEIQFSAYTLAASMNTAMTSIVTAYSVNVFTLKIKFLKASNSTKLAIRIVISIIETAITNIAVVTYIISLSYKGKTYKNAKWYNTKMSIVKDDPDDRGINNYVYTTADVEGKADYWVAQLVILSISSVIVAILIMYRWHFSKGGTRSDWIEIVKEEAKAEQKEIATQCSGHTETQLPIIEEKQKYKKALRTIKSTPDRIEGSR